MPNTNVEDEELRKKIRDEWLIHEEDCQYSMFDIPCDCIQDDVSKNIMQLIAARERKAVELESLETGKYVASQIINGVSAQDLYSAFCKSIDELTSTKDKS